VCTRRPCKQVSSFFLGIFVPSLSPHNLVYNATQTTLPHFFLSSRNLVYHATTLPSLFPRATSCTTPQRYLVSFLAQPRVPRHNATSSLSSRNLVYHATTLPPLFPRATLSGFSRVLRSRVSNFVSPCAFRICGEVRVFFFPSFFLRLKEFLHLSLGYRY
jgi:hypothetical protein